jgi:hypothetical protein
MLPTKATTELYNLRLQLYDLLLTSRHIFRVLRLRIDISRRNEVVGRKTSMTSGKANRGYPHSRKMTSTRVSFTLMSSYSYRRFLGATIIRSELQARVPNPCRHLWHVLPFQLNYECKRKCRCSAAISSGAGRSIVTYRAFWDRCHDASAPKRRTHRDLVPSLYQ